MNTNLFQKIFHSKMEQSKKFITEQMKEGAEMILYIPSKSEKGKKHLVVYKDKQWFCDCLSSQIRNECSHIKKTKQVTETQ